MSTDTTKRADQIKLLRHCWDVSRNSRVDLYIITYPQCARDLLDSGLVFGDGRITTAGMAALYLLGEDAADPTPTSRSFEETRVPLKARTP